MTETIYPPRHPEKKPYDPKTSEHQANIVYPSTRVLGQRSN